jgi:hypothetical protein
MTPPSRSPALCMRYCAHAARVSRRGQTEASHARGERPGLVGYSRRAAQARATRFRGCRTSLCCRSTASSVTVREECMIIRLSCLIGELSSCARAPPAPRSAANWSNPSHRQIGQIHLIVVSFQLRYSARAGSSVRRRGGRGRASSSGVTRRRVWWKKRSSFSGHDTHSAWGNGERDETCPVSTGRGTKRARLVRGEGQDVSGQYGGRGGGSCGRILWNAFMLSSGSDASSGMTPISGTPHRSSALR